MIATSKTRQESRDLYGSRAKQLFEAHPGLEVMRVGDVDRETIEAIWNALAERPVLRREVVRLLARTLDHYRVAPNPARGWYGGRSKHRTRRPPTALAAQLWAAIEEAEQRGRIAEDSADFYRVALLTGLRHSEILRMRVRDVELDEPPRITVKLKTGTDETIPVGIEMTRILERRIEAAKSGWLWPKKTTKGHRGHRWKSWVGMHWDAVVEQLRKAGVDVMDRMSGETYTPGVTRSLNIHVKTRDGARAGVSLAAAMSSVGHKRLQTTLNYAPAISAEVQKGAMIMEQATIKTETALEQPDTRPEAIGRRINETRRRKLWSREQAVAAACKVAEQLVGEGRELGKTLVDDQGKGAINDIMWRGWERRCGQVEKIEIAARALGVPFRFLAEGNTR